MAVNNYLDLAKDKSKTSTNDVATKLNEDAVLESIRNILDIQPRSRVYKQRRFGANLDLFLFDPIDNETALRMLEQIEQAIGENEPRANNLIVEITPLFDENTFRIRVSFFIDESDRELVLEDTLKRIR